MKLIVLALAAFAACGAAHAQAQEPADTPAKTGRQAGLFLGAGAGSSAVEDSFGNTYGFGEIQIRGGYNFNKYLSVSAQVAIPLDTYESGGGGTIFLTDDAKLKSEYAIFIEPRAPLGDVVGLYARIGYIWTEVEVAYQFGSTYNQTGNGPAYGVGIDFDFGQHVTLAFDLTAYDTQFESAGGAGLIVKGRF